MAPECAVAKTRSGFGSTNSKIAGLCPKLLDVSKRNVHDRSGDGSPSLAGWLVQLGVSNQRVVV
jgi:hypothetical protein